MNDFEFDCLQKKRLAHQAKYRKRGSKSKKCPMSTDYMTRRQWLERCGKIVTVNMNEPITWKVFKELSKQTQEEYIHNLMGLYSVNATSLAAMFHIQPLTVRRHIAAQQLAVSFPVGHSMNAEQRRAWERFINGKQGEENNTVEATETTDENPTDNKMEMSGFSLRFNGPIDISMIANSLTHILGNNAVGEVEIRCSLT